MSHSNAPPVKKLAPLTTRSSSLKCVSSAENHTAEQQYSKTGRTKPRKHLRRSNLPWNTCHDFPMIPRLGEDALLLRRISVWFPEQIPKGFEKLSYRKVGLTTMSITQDLFSGTVDSFFYRILPEPGQPRAQLSKLICYTACKKTKHKKT